MLSFQARTIRRVNVDFLLGVFRRGSIGCDLDWKRLEWRSNMDSHWQKKSIRKFDRGDILLSDSPLPHRVCTTTENLRTEAKSE